MKAFFLLALSLLLAACGSNPQSYLEPKKEPIVNVEASLADALHIEANRERLSLQNQSPKALHLAYKLFWYDTKGVSQASPQNWQTLWLQPQQQQAVELIKPSAESENYRVYLRPSL